jgi:four helix bundle protein
MATRTFPQKGYADLKTQMVRSADSVLFNIAEGCGASSQKELARYLGISSKSTMELECQLELAKAYGIISLERWEEISIDISLVRRMLWALRARVLAAPEATDNRN